MARKKINRKLTVSERVPFWQARSTTNEKGCWLWQGAKHRQGYGLVQVNSKTHLLHKLVWEDRNGPTPDGKELDHTCRIFECWNPDHLEPVTHAINVQRGNKTGWVNTHCFRGHEYTTDNIRVTGNKRRCKTCLNMTQRRRYWAKKAA